MPAIRFSNLRTLLCSGIFDWDARVEMSCSVFAIGGKVWGHPTNFHTKKCWNFQRAEPLIVLFVSIHSKALTNVMQTEDGALTLPRGAMAKWAPYEEPQGLRNSKLFSESR